TVFDERDLFQKALDHLQAIAALTALAPRLEESAVVMVIRRVLHIEGGAALHCDLDAALALVGVPDAVVEAELHFLLDVAGKVVRRDPAGVDVERRLAPVGVRVDNLELNAVPGGSIDGADEAALPGGSDPCQFPVRPEREVDELEVVDGDVSARVAARNPLGELAAADLFRFEQRAVAVVDVLEDAVH